MSIPSSLFKTFSKKAISFYTPKFKL